MDALTQPPCWMMKSALASSRKRVPNESAVATDSPASCNRCSKTKGTNTYQGGEEKGQRKTKKAEGGKKPKDGEVAEVETQGQIILTGE